MTRQDFETRFNAFFAEGATPKLEDIAQFRTEALADYDTLTNATTLQTTLQSKIDALTGEVTSLRDTNYKLFKMNPAAFAPATDPSGTGASNNMPNGSANSQGNQNGDGIVHLSDLTAQLFEQPATAQ